MSDETIWHEIMRSPLDPDPEDRPRWASLALPIVAAFAGLALSFLPGSTEQASETTIATSTTTTAAVTADPDPILPEGYVEASGVGLKALAVYNSDDNLYVVVNSATRSDLDRAETPEFHIAEWVLAGDGIERTARRAVNSDLAPGIRLVEFPGVTALPASVPRLLVREATEMEVRTSCNGCAATSVDMAEGELFLDGTAVPYASSEPLVLPVGAGINISIEELQLADEWGYAKWRILDPNDARVRVILRVVFVGTDDPATENVDETQLVPPYLVGPTLQNQVGANPEAFARDGTVRMDRIGEILSADNQPEGLSLRWLVEWQHPVGDPITLPLDDVLDLGEIG